MLKTLGVLIVTVTITVAQFCPYGSSGIYPNCYFSNNNLQQNSDYTINNQQTETCPEGTHGYYPNCHQLELNECPEGTTGSYPDCRKAQPTKPPPPPYSDVSYQKPVNEYRKKPVYRPTYNYIPSAVQKCPIGKIGIYPNCRHVSLPPIPIPPPQRRPTQVVHSSPLYLRPHTTQRQCPFGTVGVYPSCYASPKPKKYCPSGSIGHYPNCNVIKVIPSIEHCPPGTRGVYPNCISTQTNNYQAFNQACPPGTGGRYPNCHRQLLNGCPPGTDGHYPDCYIIRKAKPVVTPCPPGTSGVFPNCYSTQRETRPVVEYCPTGTVGTYPNCYQPSLNLCDTKDGLRTQKCQYEARLREYCQKPDYAYKPDCACPTGHIGRQPDCIPPEYDRLYNVAAGSVQSRHSPYLVASGRNFEQYASISYLLKSKRNTEKKD